MIVDNKQFTPGSPPRAGTLWIVSQAPGSIFSVDATPVLVAQGYWASYNIPYFPELWKLLGYESLVQQYGAEGQSDAAGIATSLQRSELSVRANCVSLARSEMFLTVFFLLMPLPLVLLCCFFVVLCVRPPPLPSRLFRRVSVSFFATTRITRALASRVCSKKHL